MPDVVFRLRRHDVDSTPVVCWTEITGYAAKRAPQKRSGDNDKSINLFAEDYARMGGARR
jgi:hypothetical protein